MANGWMIRAGRGGKLIEDFESGYIAIGWNELGDLTKLRSANELRDAYISIYGNAKPSRTANSVAMLRKFRDEIHKGDTVISYSSERREYLVGEEDKDKCDEFMKSLDIGLPNKYIGCPKCDKKKQKAI